MYLLDLYDLEIQLPSGQLVFSILYSTGLVCVSIGLISYLFPEIGIPGQFYLLTLFFTVIHLLLWRIVFDLYLTRFGRMENLLIIGSENITTEIEKEISAREKFGFRLVGYINSGPGGGTTNPNKAPCLGGYDDISRVVKDRDVKKIIIAITERRGGYPVQSLLALRASGVRILEWPGFLENLTGRIPIDNLAPSYFIYNDGFRKSRSILLSRRCFSAFLAAVLLVLFLPVMILVAVAIRLDSNGPVFYTQYRVGQGERRFKIIKFRSMRVDAEEDGKPQWTVKNDPRITRVGKFIRTARLDELPQLINVLRGDLDIVGPRPERPEFVEEFNRRITYYTLRHTVKPGVTGWAQVMFHYSGTIEESKKKLQYDLFYIKNMSVKLDLYILFRTVKIVLLGRGAL
jgi:sugar transferase (PEP-CTERM system associated)